MLFEFRFQGSDPSFLVFVFTHVTHVVNWALAKLG